MNPFIRNAQICASELNALVFVFLVELILSVGNSFHPIAPLVLLVSIILTCLIGMVAYQIGYHPIVAVLIFATALIPYVSFIVLLGIMIQARYYLQNQNYNVGLLGARRNTQERIQVASVPWQKHVGWLAVFVGLPILLFLILWILNPEYMANFFQPRGEQSWVGPYMLVIACATSLLTLPLSIEFQRLRAIRPSAGATTFKRIFICLLAIFLCVVSCAIIALTPAVITMSEQMRHTH